MRIAHYADGDQRGYVADGQPRTIFSQPVDGLWVPAGTNAVQSVALSSFPGAFTETLSGFAAYLFNTDVGPNSRTDTADFVVSIIDTTPGAPNGGLLHSRSVSGVPVTALPGLNKSIIFLLDHTSSMRAPGNTQQRFQRLKVAVLRGLGLLTGLITDNDQVGVVSWDHVPKPESIGGTLKAPLISGGMAAARTACEVLAIDTSFPVNKVSQTSIDFAHAQDPTRTATVIVVTDGVTVQNPTPFAQLIQFPSAMQALPTSVLFLETPTDNKAFNMRSSGGATAISPAGTGEFTIEKLLSQVLIDLSGATTVSDPDGSLGADERVSFPLTINETDHEVTAILFSEQAELLNIELHGPGLLPEQNEQAYCHSDDRKAESKKFLVTRRKLAAIRPEPPDDGAAYSLVVSRAKTEKVLQKAVGFTFVAAVQSDLMLDAVASASGLEVGADLLFSARLTEYDLPVRDREDITVHVELRHPDGGLEEVPLPERSPGHFEASRRAFRPGVYLAHFIATGKTMLQRSLFRREVLRSVLIFESGSTSSCCPPHQTPKAHKSE